VSHGRDLLNSKTILRNTVWYGLENVISFASSLITSIAIARTLGPTKMGYVIYVMWVANIASTFGSIGIPATTRKYMAEYLGAGDHLTARFIYFRTLWLQAITATLATGCCLVWVLRSSPPEFRIAAVLLVLSIWPSMVNFVSAQANVASEQLSANLPGSAAATATFFALIMLTLGFHWGVIGVASAMLAMRLVDFLVRLFPALRRIHASGAHGFQAPAELRRRMLSFALQSMAGMALTLIVWDRSEIFLLKYLSGDLRQIAFYSVAFSLAERLLVFPTVFASATGASVFAQYGRDRSRVAGMTAASARYLGLTSIPLHFIATALAGAALMTLYGKQYAGAIAVSMAAPLLCLPKAFLSPVQTLFEAVEKQKFFIWATIVASAIDVGIAWWLIPRYGALGAALGSGSAQVVAITTLWVLGIRRYQISLPWAFLGKVSLISALAAVTAYGIVAHTPPIVGLLVGGSVAIVVFLGLAALLRVFEEQDVARLKIIVDACPKIFSSPVNLTYSWMSRRVAPAITEELL
jgi:O-antigen/teichoic acid export membrane protein